MLEYTTCSLVSTVVAVNVGLTFVVPLGDAPAVAVGVGLGSTVGVGVELGSTVGDAIVVGVVIPEISTATGVGLSTTVPPASLEPSPSWPRQFTPQQCAVPLEVSPHVCMEPATRLANLRFPVTAPGASLSYPPLVPSPSTLQKLTPQQYAEPVRVSPQVWSCPAARLLNPIPPATATGSTAGIGLE